MDHASLVEITLKVTGYTALVAIGAYYHFDKKLGHTYGISKEYDDSVLGMRRAISKDLSDILESAYKNTSIEVSSTPESYDEKLSNALGSEQFKNAIHDFIANRSDAIVDYQQIQRYCSRHLGWLKTIIDLSRLLIAISGLSWIGIKIAEAAEYTTPNFILIGIIGAVIVDVISIGIFETIRVRNAHHAMELRSKYETF